jgi:SAM-dependent methyltransferase
VIFTCNICGAQNEVEKLATEPASCACGSNVRVRALIHLLSLELFGVSMTLSEFPRLKGIRGIGMTDKESYASRLAEKFDYTNTHYDREPRLDVRESHPHLAGAYDFILAADVLEHIAPPLESALAELHRLLKPRGFLGITIYCDPGDRTREHYPDLNEYRVVLLGGSPVVLNRRKDGRIDVHDGPILHGGTGETLEMREFGVTGLRSYLCGAGFRDLNILTEPVPEYGIVFDHDLSQPLIARKERYLMDRVAQDELLGLWRRQAAMREQLENRSAQLDLADQSRWIRLGRILGVGPKFS